MLDEAKLNALLTQIGYQRGSGKGDAQEVWVVYHSRAIQADNQCFIGTVNEISMLPAEAIKQRIEEITEEIDQKILSGIRPL